jgi:hypothetical protein
MLDVVATHKSDWGSGWLRRMRLVTYCSGSCQLTPCSAYGPVDMASDDAEGQSRPVAERGTRRSCVCKDHGPDCM